MKRSGDPWPRLTVGLAIGLALAATAAAQGTSTEELARRLAAEGAKLNEFYDSLSTAQRMLDANRRLLEAQRTRVDAILRELSARGAIAPLPQPAPLSRQAPLPPPAAAEIRGGQAPLVTQAPNQGEKPKPVGEAPPTAPLPQTAQIFGEPTVLTRAGGFTLEPSLQYIHASNNRVALVGFTIIPAITIGLIDIRRVTRDAWYAALTGRYGVTSRFELEAKVPYVYSSTSTLTRPLATPSVTDTQFDSHGDGIGDVEFGGRYQLNAFRGDNVVYVAGLRVRAPTGKGPFEVDYDPVTNLQIENPTGAGFWGVQPGISFVFPSDPAVFFGGLAYTYNFSRTYDNGFAKINPGGVTDLAVGMGLALNERASFSAGFQLSNVGKTTQSGNPAPGKTLSPSSSTLLGTARFGVTYAFTRQTALNLTLGIGVTRETPDLEVTVRVPMTF